MAKTKTTRYRNALAGPAKREGRCARAPRPR